MKGVKKETNEKGNIILMGLIKKQSESLNKIVDING